MKSIHPKDRVWYLKYRFRSYTFKKESEDVCTLLGYRFFYLRPKCVWIIDGGEFDHLEFFTLFRVAEFLENIYVELALAVWEIEREKNKQ